MKKYTVEIMLGSYKDGPTIDFFANSDEEAHAIARIMCKKQHDSIAFSISTRVGRRKIYL